MERKNNWLTELSEDSNYWVDDFLHESNIPSVIVFEYDELKHLSKAGNVYGVLLQMKDLFETIIKVPIIMSWGVIEEECDKESDSYQELIYLLLKKEMAMGDWKRVAEKIVESSEGLCVPNELRTVLKKTNALFSKDIGDKDNIVHWRNREIGHGALKFESSSDYQAEVKDALELLVEYFAGRSKTSPTESYESLMFVQNDLDLTGTRCISSNGEITLRVDDRSYSMEPLISFSDEIAHFFESYIAHKGNTRYLDYLTGKETCLNENYFSTLFHNLALQRRSEDDLVSSDIVWSDDEKALSEMATEEDRYIKPKFIVDEIEDIMDELGKGVITICMERGMGKTALASKLDGQFHRPLIKNAEIRTYHIQGGTFRGVADFVSAFNNYFKSNYKGRSFRFLKSMDISAESNSPSRDFANALASYHEAYGSEYTLFVIDGVDEITSDLKNIMNFIPKKDMMKKGTFVVFTTRFEDEEGINPDAKKNITMAKELSDAVITVDRNDERYIRLLEQYIGVDSKKGPTDIQKLMIEKSDRRFLYIKILSSVSESINWDFENKKKVFEEYYAHLQKMYGTRFIHEINRILSVIALTGGFTFETYERFFQGNTSVFSIGALNDITPLLSAERTIFGTRYRFANEEYYYYAKELLKESVIEYAGVFLSEMDSGNSTTQDHRWHKDLSDEKEVYLQNTRYGFLVDTLENIIAFLEEEGHFSELFMSSKQVELHALYYILTNGYTPQNIYQQLSLLIPRIFELYIKELVSGCANDNSYLYDYFFSYEELFLDYATNSDNYDVLIQNLVKALRKNSNKQDIIKAVVNVTDDTHIDLVTNEIKVAKCETLFADELWNRWEMGLVPEPEFDYFNDCYETGNWERYYEELRNDVTGKRKRISWYIDLCRSILNKCNLTKEPETKIVSLMVITQAIVFREKGDCEELIEKIGRDELLWPAIPGMDSAELESKIVAKICSEDVSELWDKYSSDKKAEEHRVKIKGYFEQLRQAAETDEIGEALFAFKKAKELREEYTQEELKEWTSIKDKYLERQLALLDDNLQNITSGTLLELLELSKDEGVDVDDKNVMIKKKDLILESVKKGEEDACVNPNGLYQRIIDLFNDDREKIKEILKEYCLNYSSIPQTISCKEIIGSAYCDRAAVSLLVLLVDSENTDETGFAKAFIKKLDETNAAIEKYYIANHNFKNNKDIDFYLNHMENLLVYLYTCTILELKPKKTTSSTFSKYAELAETSAKESIRSIDEYTVDNYALLDVGLPMAHCYYANRSKQGEEMASNLLEHLKDVVENKLKEENRIATKLRKFLELGKLHFRILQALESDDYDNKRIETSEDAYEMCKDAASEIDYIKVARLLIDVPDQYYNSILRVASDFYSGDMSTLNTYRIHVYPIIKTLKKHIDISPWQSDRRFVDYDM